MEALAVVSETGINTTRDPNQVTWQKEPFGFAICTTNLLFVNKIRSSPSLIKNWPMVFPTKEKDGI
jgi:hypothetical protein